MRTTAGTILAAIALSAAPAQPAALQADAGHPAQQRPAPIIATHATSGIVKSVDQTSLVLQRKTGVHGELRFVLTSATERVGEVTVGSTVEVRYRLDGHQRIATAVSAEPPHK